MAYVIAEPCITVKDRACVEVCPVDCIHPRTDEDKGERLLYIHPDECIDYYKLSGEAFKEKWGVEP